MNDALHEEARAIFDPELDLGLTIRTLPILRIPRSWSAAVRTGDDDWDYEIESFADEPERARCLLGRDVRAPILQLNIEHPNFAVADTHAVMFPYPDLEAALRTIADLGRRIHAARARVPCATPVRAHAETWAELAKRHALQLEQTPLSASGTIRGIAWSARTRRVRANVHAIEIRAAWPDAPLGAGLTVRRETVGDKLRMPFRGADVRVDDPIFDRAFLVVAQHVERARRLFDADVRAALLEAAQAFTEIELTDIGLAFRAEAAALDPRSAMKAWSWTELVLDRIARIATGMRAPYR